MMSAPYTTMSLNLQGVKNPNRLNQALNAGKRAKADIIMAQEHNITADLEASSMQKARRMGYILCLGPCPMNTTRGGSAVLVRAAAFKLRRSATLDFSVHLDGRVTVATIPTTACPNASEDSPPLRVAAVYVPSNPQARGRFTKALAELSPFRRDMIVGVDANTVPDVSLDVKYPEGSNTTYQNQHAQAFERVMANAGLVDVYRQFHGKQARGYSRLGKTVFTRIDRIYGPAKMDGQFQWYSYEFSSSMVGRTWNSDHLAVVATLNHNNGAGKAPGRPKIDTDIYTDPDQRSCIRDAIIHVINSYPTEVYGEAVVWEYFKHTLRELSRRLSADRKFRATKVTFLEQRLQAQVTSATATPTPAFHNKLNKRRTALKKAINEYKEINGEVALRRTQLDEIPSNA